MMSSLVNTILFLALVITSLCVLAMYRKLKRLDAYHAEYKRIFDQTADALGSANDAVRTITTDGREILEELGIRIDEAKKIIAELKAVDRTFAPQDAGRNTAEAP